MVPKMAKMVNMKMMKKKTRIRPGIELRSDWIYRRIVGILLIDLRGLRIRKVLKAFKLSEPPEIGSMPMMLIITMKKSRQFQASLR